MFQQLPEDEEIIRIVVQPDSDTPPVQVSPDFSSSDGGYSPLLGASCPSSPNSDIDDAFFLHNAPLMEALQEFNRHASGSSNSGFSATSSSSSPNSEVAPLTTSFNHVSLGEDPFSANRIPLRPIDTRYRPSGESSINSEEVDHKSEFSEMLLFRKERSPIRSNARQSGYPCTFSASPSGSLRTGEDLFFEYIHEDVLGDECGTVDGTAVVDGNTASDQKVLSLLNLQEGAFSPFSEISSDPSTSGPSSANFREQDPYLSHPDQFFVFFPSPAPENNSESQFSPNLYPPDLRSWIFPGESRNVSQDDVAPSSPDNGEPGNYDGNADPSHGRRHRRSPSSSPYTRPDEVNGTSSSPTKTTAEYLTVPPQDFGPRRGLRRSHSDADRKKYVRNRQHSHVRSCPDSGRHSPFSQQASQMRPLQSASQFEVVSVMGIDIMSPILNGDSGTMTSQTSSSSSVEGSEPVKKRVASEAIVSASYNRRVKEARFACAVCGATFTANHNLKNHLNSHNGIRDFKCDFCTRAFTTAGVLARHVKNTHSTTPL